VLIHANTEDTVRASVIDPLTLFASDGFDITPGSGHPRSSNTNARVLGRYVREQKALSLMQALRKMTLMPAQRLQARAPQMLKKGRLRPGMDADIAVFDPEHIIDRATYEDPSRFAEGMRFVLVAGQFVVRDGHPLEGATPGQPVRAEVR
jgi:dihydroorotase